MATPEDENLHPYDHTKLSSINSCPTYGIIRYSHHKRMPGSRRSMPLEAGSAAHESFAAVRLFWFGKGSSSTILHEQYLHHGSRLFGPDRFNQMLGVLNVNSTDRTNCINFAIEALETSGFYDDIGDSKRTISNISEGLIAYVDAYDPDRYDVWVRDVNDPKSDIGIEIAFDIVVNIVYNNGGLPTNKNLECRFTGKLDGLYTDPKRKDALFIVDDKTSGKLDDNWLAQWVLSHQFTGYCIASSTFTGLPCHKAQAWGMRIPIGKIAAEGIRREQVNRHQELYNKWAGWFVEYVNMENRFRDYPLQAPMHTTNCNSYNSTCSFLPLCAADSMEEKELIFSEMEIDEWSPLHD